MDVELEESAPLLQILDKQRESERETGATEGEQHWHEHELDDRCLRAASPSALGANEVDQRCADARRHTLDCKVPERVLRRDPSVEPKLQACTHTHIVIRSRPLHAHRSLCASAHLQNALNAPFSWQVGVSRRPSTVSERWPRWSHAHF